MKLTCIILTIVTILLMAAGIYCYVANVDNCRINYSSWDEEWREYSIIDNLTDPESFIAGLFWNLGLIALIATVIMILIYKKRVQEHPEIASIRGAAKARRIAKLNEIRGMETIRLIRDCKLYTVLIPFYFAFGLFFFVGLIMYCVYPEEDMWIVPIIEFAGFISFFTVGINLIKKTFNMKKEINSRNISEEDHLAAKTAFRNFVIVMVAITVIASLISCISILGAIESGSDGSGSNQSAITATAKSAVRSQLKAPSSAKFSNTSVTESGTNTWIVTGFVEAKNSFGVSLRNTYTVTVTRTSDGNYRATSCIIK